MGVVAAEKGKYVLLKKPGIETDRCRDEFDWVRKNDVRERFSEDIAESSPQIHVDGKVWLHDQVRDMERAAVLQESRQDPGLWSRLWARECCSSPNAPQALSQATSSATFSSAGQTMLKSVVHPLAMHGPDVNASGSSEMTPSEQNRNADDANVGEQNSVFLFCLPTTCILLQPDSSFLLYIAFFNRDQVFVLHFSFL
ncbi:hypothetical protein MLD38_001362 [Melastoma candidum]|uniref:Uncharacterized protein n=1 Tax=Melastoma candidum TaxID=119954 RepID=A0ACB9SCG2_9MYRT|nr:hypothetical protein MLD38_001362 [Melastoma candidum]